MRMDEITPEQLMKLDHGQWNAVYERARAALVFADVPWPLNIHRMIFNEAWRRIRKDVEWLSYYDAVRVERYPGSGPREYPESTYKEWSDAWEPTGVEPQPGNPN